jgi:hypothetical protein
MSITGAVPFRVELSRKHNKPLEAVYSKTSGLIAKDHTLKSLNGHDTLEDNQPWLYLLDLTVKDKRAAERCEETE